MEEKKDTTEPSLIDQLKAYIETSVTLAKYKAVEKGTSLIAGIIIDLAVVLVVSVTFLFASFTLALYLSDVLASYWKGFGVVALFYLLLVIIIVLAKRNFERPIINAFIKKIFK